MKHITKVITPIAALAVVALVSACESGPTEPASAEFHSTPGPEAVESAATDTPPPPMHKKFKGRHGKGPHMLLKAIKRHGDEIGLSEEQKTSIRARIDESRNKMRPDKTEKMDEMKAHFGEMRDLFTAEQLDEKSLLAKQQQMQSKFSPMKAEKLDVLLDVLEMLTPEQRVSLAGIIAQCHESKGEAEGCKGMHEGMKGKHGPKGMHGKKGMRGPGKMLAGAIRILADEVGQTDEQKASIKQIFKQGREDGKLMHEQIGSLREQLRPMLLAEKFDRNAIEAKHAEIVALEQEMHSARFGVLLDVLQVLSVDQRVQMFDTLAECKPGPGEGMPSEKCMELFKGFGHKGKKGMHGKKEMHPGMGFDESF